MSFYLCQWYQWYISMFRFPHFHDDDSWNEVPVVYHFDIIIRDRRSSHRKKSHRIASHYVVLFVFRCDFKNSTILRFSGKIVGWPARWLAQFGSPKHWERGHVRENRPRAIQCYDMSCIMIACMIFSALWVADVDALPTSINYHVPLLPAIPAQLWSLSWWHLGYPRDATHSNTHITLVHGTWFVLCKNIEHCTCESPRLACIIVCNGPEPYWMKSVGAQKKWPSVSECYLQFDIFFVVSRFYFK